MKPTSEIVASTVTLCAESMDSVARIRFDLRHILASLQTSAFSGLGMKTLLIGRLQLKLTSAGARMTGGLP